VSFSLPLVLGALHRHLAGRDFPIAGKLSLQEVRINLEAEVFDEELAEVEFGLMGVTPVIDAAADGAQS
jgi:hypothetical protein